MEQVTTFKPVLWRLMLWAAVPLWLGWNLAEYAFTRINSADAGPTFPFIDWNVGVLIGSMLGIMIFRKQFDIVISKDKVTGIRKNALLRREEFFITDLDVAVKGQQKTFEKVLGEYTLRSIHGQKIYFPHFIYGKPAVREIYRLLESRHVLLRQK